MGQKRSSTRQDGEHAEPAGQAAEQAESPQQAPETERSGAVAEVLERLPDDPEDFKPAGAELVVVSGDDTALLQVLDRHDELAILDNLRAKLGKQLGKVLLYDFWLGGQRVIDLSVQGVWECVWEMNATGKVSVQVDRSVPPVFEEEFLDTDFGPGVPHVTCTVFARCERTGAGTWGTFAQPRRMKLTAKTVKARKEKEKFVPEPDAEGHVVMSDPFARQKALNKAERNALRKLVPEFVAQTLIAQYKGEAGAVREIMAGPGAEKLAEFPAPLESDEAKALRAEIEGLYRELRGLNAEVLLPAAFNHYMTHAAHALDRLELFREHVASLVEKERAA